MVSLLQNVTECGPPFEPTWEPHMVNRAGYVLRAHLEGPFRDRKLSCFWDQNRDSEARQKKIKIFLRVKLLTSVKQAASWGRRA